MSPNHRAPDVPIGAWLMAAVFDAIAWTDRAPATARLSDLCVLVGLASAVPTAATGLTDWSGTTGRASRIGVVHAASNIAATLLYAGSMVSRANRSMRLALAYSGFCVMLIGGFLGGHLVFNEGVGVDGPTETSGAGERARSSSVHDLMAKTT